MHITLSPQVREDTLSLSKSGDILTINGEAFDFTSVPDGGEIGADKVPCELIVGSVRRVNAELHLTMIFPYSSDDAPESVRFPQPITVTGDGPISLPGGSNVEA